MKYNRALDHVALAIKAMVVGKPELAAKHFTKAAAQPDAADALRIIEASNAKAFEVEAAAKKVEAAKKVAPAKKVAAKKVAPSKKEVDASKRLRASDEEVMDDEDELGADLVEDEEAMQDEVPQEELAGDLDELDDEEDDEEDEDEEAGEDAGAAFAKVLSSMHSRKAGK